MEILKKIVTFICCLFLPVKLFYWLLNILGHQVHPKSRIGFSFIWIDGCLSLGPDSKIGNFNLIRLDNLQINDSGYIGGFNNIKGPLTIILDHKGVIGNGNSIYRPALGVSYDKSVLSIGTVAGITSHHRIDCTRNVRIGNYSTIAGHDSQLWTHAYYHDKAGPGRFRVDGDIEIGNNVYIGSRCVLNSGIKIADNVVVGANSCVSKSLPKAGTYVSQSLRFIEMNGGDQRLRFKKIEGPTVCEEVYERKE